MATLVPILSHDIKLVSCITDYQRQSTWPKGNEFVFGIGG